MKIDNLHKDCQESRLLISASSKIFQNNFLLEVQFNQFLKMGRKFAFGCVFFFHFLGSTQNQLPEIISGHG